MAGGAAKLSFEESLDEFPGEFRAFDAATETEDIHVVVFNALARGEIIFNETGAGAFNFIGADGRADAAAAYGDAAFHFAVGNGAGEGNNEVRIIVGGIKDGRAEVGDLMAGILEARGECLFEFKSAVVGCDSDAHKMSG